MEEDIKILKEIIEHKNDYDLAFGTKIVRPYSIDREEIQALENLLTRYKQLKKENKELREEECCMTTCLRKDKEKVFLENKVKEKIEELKKDLERDRICIDFVIEHTKDIELMAEIKVLQELLEE